METGNPQTTALLTLLPLLAARAGTKPVWESVFLINILLQKDIPFEITYEPDTRKTAAALLLTIHVNSEITITKQL